MFEKTTDTGPPIGHPSIYFIKREFTEKTHSKRRLTLFEVTLINVLAILHSVSDSIGFLVSVFRSQLRSDGNINPMNYFWPNCRLILLTLREKCSYLELFWSAFSRIWTEYGEILSVRVVV